MILNAIFLVGGIGIGYLIRGEIDRYKSRKAKEIAFNEGKKLAESFINSLNKLNEKEEINNEEDDTDNAIEEISFENIVDMFKDVNEQSNSTDETIRL